MLLEGELGLLEGEQRLLHADRRQQDHLGHARRTRGPQHIDMRLMVDLPGVARNARP